jgi:hypothetical protein
LEKNRIFKLSFKDVIITGINLKERGKEKVWERGKMNMDENGKRNKEG